MELSGIIAKVSKEVLAQLDGKTAVITPKEVIADISCSMLNPDVSRDEEIFACEEAEIKRLRYADICILRRV